MKLRAYHYTDERFLNYVHLNHYFLLLTDGSIFTPTQVKMDYSLDKKDIEGVEIFTSDIIEAELAVARGAITMGVIVYDKESCTYGSQNDAGLTPLYNLRKIKVIGNIYENPDLMG